MNQDTSHSEPDGSILDIAVALVIGYGRVLVTRRLPTAHLGGLWEFPGGKVRQGELAAECAVRETWEEVRVRCAARGTLTSVVHSYEDRTVRLHPILCSYLGGSPRADKVADWRWISATQLRQLSWPEANQAILDDLLTRAEVLGLRPN